MFSCKAAGLRSLLTVCPDRGTWLLPFQVGRFGFCLTFVKNALTAQTARKHLPSGPIGMSLPRTSWVRLNHLRTDVGCFHSSMYKWGLASSPNCECGATKQTADHVISLCLLHHVPRGTRDLQFVDDATRCWLNTTTASI